MQAIGENVLVLRPHAVERKQGSIIIPNGTKSQFYVGEIFSVGTDVEDLKLTPGTKVLVRDYECQLHLGDKTDGAIFCIAYDDIITTVEDGEV